MPLRRGPSRPRGDRRVDDGIRFRGRDVARRWSGSGKGDGVSLALGRAPGSAVVGHRGRLGRCRRRGDHREHDRGGEHRSGDDESGGCEAQHRAGARQDAAADAAGGAARPRAGRPRAARPRACDIGSRRRGQCAGHHRDGVGHRSRCAGRHGREGRRAALQRREIGRRSGDADRERQQHECEPVRDLAGLGRHDGAARAVGEVGVDLARVALSEVAARVGAEAVDRPPAGRSVVDAAQVGLDPRFAQPLARAKGELCDGRRLEAQQGSDLRRLHALDLGVPEHLLPAGRKAPERLRRDAAVERVRRRLRARRGVLHRLELIGRRLATGSAPRGRGVADAREEIGAERAGGPASLEDRLVDARVRLLHEVVGVERRGDGASDGHSGAVVASPQLSERLVVTGSCAQHEVGVAQRRHRGTFGLCHRSVLHARREAA